MREDRRSGHAGFDRDRQRQDKRDVVLEAAATLFRARGYSTTSLDAIATHLQITKPALYYYFSNKQEILFECFSRTFDEAEKALTEAVEKGGTGREVLERYFLRYLVVQLEGSVPIVPMSELRALTPELQERLNRRRKVRRDKLRQLVLDGIEDRSIRDCDPKIVISAWAGATSWLFDAYAASPSADASRIAEEVRTLFLHGLIPLPEKG